MKTRKTRQSNLCVGLRRPLARQEPGLRADRGLQGELHPGGPEGPQVLQGPPHHQTDNPDSISLIIIACQFPDINSMQHEQMSPRQMMNLSLPNKNIMFSLVRLILLITY